MKSGQAYSHVIHTNTYPNHHLFLCIRKLMMDEMKSLFFKEFLLKTELVKNSQITKPLHSLTQF